MGFSCLYHSNGGRHAVVLFRYNGGGVSGKNVSGVETVSKSV